jgi:archaellum biogenesis protein FlaJ (TadC family)
MAVFVFCLTQILKMPIKWATKKFKNERTRKLVNTIILLIPFAVGVGLEFVYSTYTHTLFTIIAGLGYGTGGISLYGIIERFFGIKSKNPYDSEEGKAVTELIENITKDGKVDKKDNEIVKDFVSDINKVK